MAVLFSNTQLRGKKLEFSLRSAFDLMVDRAGYTSWLPFLNTYRTLCVAPPPEFRELICQVGTLAAAA